MRGTDGWLVVGSTAAGSSGEEAIEAVAGRLSRSGPATTAVTGGLDELDDVVRGCGSRTLVAVGGDGSAHAVVNSLDRTGLLAATTVGFVPLGTANDFASHLGMASDPRAAADQLLEGPTRWVDLLRIDGDELDRPTLVVNALHAGLGVTGARRAAPLKPVLRRFAYPLGVVSSGLVSRGSTMSVVVDGEPVGDRSRILAVAVANAPRLGGVELVADADPGDGRLRVLVVPGDPWTARLGAARRHLTGAVEDSDHRTGRAVDLTGDLGLVDADGEMLDVGGRCRVVVERAVLRVMTPSGPDQPPTNSPTANTTP